MQQFLKSKVLADCLANWFIQASVTGEIKAEIGAFIGHKS